MPTRNVHLTDHYDQFVDALIISGRFSNASEVMRAGLRLLEQQAREDEQKLAALRALAAEAFIELDQGQGTAIDGPDDVKELIGQLGRRSADEGKRRKSGS